MGNASAGSSLVRCPRTVETKRRCLRCARKKKVKPSNFIPNRCLQRLDIIRSTRHGNICYCNPYRSNVVFSTMDVLHARVRARARTRLWLPLGLIEGYIWAKKPGQRHPREVLHSLVVWSSLPAGLAARSRHQHRGRGENNDECLVMTALPFAELRGLFI